MGDRRLSPPDRSVPGSVLQGLSVPCPLSLSASPALSG